MKFFTLWTDDWLAGTFPLTPTERGVFVTLVVHFINKDRVVPDHDQHLARLCNMSTRGFRAAKQTLLDGDFIEVRDGHIWSDKAAETWKKDQKYSENLRLKAEKKHRMIRANSLETMEGNPPSALLRAPPSPSPSPKEIPRKKVSLPHTPTTSSGRDVSLGFAEWWGQYLKKHGKKKAEAEYRRIVQRGEATIDFLLDGLLRYNQSRDVRRGFILNPITWLNQGRWDDGPDLADTPEGDGSISIMEAIRNG